MVFLIGYCDVVSDWKETDAAKSLVQPFLDDFCQHADAVCFVTRLAADSSSNAASE